MRISILFPHSKIVNMTFKAKLRKIGNSQGVYIPKNVITGYNIGDVITLCLEEEVITGENEILDVKHQIITKEKGQFKIFNVELCKKHAGSMKGTCGCK